MNRQAVLKKVLLLKKLFEEGKVPTLKNHEVHPTYLKKGSRERYLYFTLVPALNFQRNSPALWKSALATWNDKETQYVFFPEKAIRAQYAKFQKHLTKHNLALQPNKHVHIWLTLCKTLAEKFASDPRKLLSTASFDVPEVLRILHDNKKDFPYLSGPKLSNYWLYILNHYTDAVFKNAEEISVIPDTHIIQSSMQLGLVSRNAKQEAVTTAWKKVLHGTGISPSQMHPVLWNWSRNNFLPRV